MADTLTEFRKFVDLIEGRAMACDGPVTPFLEELNVASDEEKKRFTAILGAIYKTPPQAEPSIGITLTAETVIAMRDAMVRNDVEEAYHQLYKAVDPKYCRLHPWADIERAALSASEVEG